MTVKTENPFTVKVTYTDDGIAEFVYKSYNITQSYIEFRTAEGDVFVIPLQNVYVFSMKDNPDYVKES